MENKELETWLQETKAKNLSLEELKVFARSVGSYSSIELFMQLKEFLKVSYSDELAEILFNQWQKEAEFSPKRGDRVLVYNENENKAEEAIFFEKDKERILVFDDKSEYEDYLKDITNASRFIINQFKHMKPLPTKQPKETDFKSQVIELIEKRIKESDEKMQNNIKDNQLIFASAWQNYKTEANEILKAIENLN